MAILTIFIKLWVLFVSLGFAAGAKNSNGIMVTSNPNATEFDDIGSCFVYSKDLSPAEPTVSYSVWDISSRDLCSENFSEEFNQRNSSTTVLLVRDDGACNIIYHIQKLGGSGLLLISNNTYSLSKSVYLNIFGVLNPHSWSKTNNIVGQLRNGMTVKFFKVPAIPPLDPSPFVLGALAIFCVIVGSCTKSDEAQISAKMLEVGKPLKDINLETTTDLESGSAKTRSDEFFQRNITDEFNQEVLNNSMEDLPMENQIENKLESLLIENSEVQNNVDGKAKEGMLWYLGILVTMITTLVLMFFFYKYIIYIFIGLYCLLGWASLHDHLKSILQSLGLIGVDSLHLRLNGIVIAAVTCLVPIIWFVLRFERWSWVLQDFLGVCICVHFIQSTKISSLRTCTILLSIMFLYDFFFVYITAYFTESGRSVMEAAISSPDAQYSSEPVPKLCTNDCQISREFESSPFVFAVPQLSNGIFAVCGNSILGFGDVLFPGLLVNFAFRWDKYNISRKGGKYMPYFISTIIGYTISLVMTFFVSLSTGKPQPALVFIVPTILIPVFVIGIIRKEVRALWTG